MISVKSQDIIRAISAGDGETTMGCADVLEQIEQFVTTTDESVWAANHPTLYQHVIACGHCAAVYADLSWVMGQAAARTLVEPASYPPADLSFLPDRLTRLQQQAGQVVSRGHFWIRSVHGVVWLSLAQYLQARPLHAATKNPHANEHLVHLACEPDENLAIEIIAEHSADEHVTVTAHVRQPDRFHQGYGGSEVSLHFGREQRTGQTNEAGRIVFAPIPAFALSELVVQVVPFGCLR